MSSATIEDLARIGVFADLSPEHRAELAVGMSPFHVPAGEVLFRQDDPPGDLYLLLAGRVRLSVRVADEGVRELAEVGEGEALGAFGLIDNIRRSASATAVVPTSGLVLPLPVFHSARAALRPAAYALLRPLARQLAVDARALIDAMTGTRSIQAVPWSEEHRQRFDIGEAGHRREQLVGLPGLSAFSSAELDRLLAGASWLDVPRGETVIGRGEPAGALGFVVRGAVQGTIELSDGDVLRLPLAIPGMTLGEIARLDGDPQPVAYTTREPTTIAGLPRGHLQDLLDAGDSAGFKLLDVLLGTLVRHLRHGNRRLVHVHAQERLDRL